MLGCQRYFSYFKMAKENIATGVSLFTRALASFFSYRLMSNVIVPNFMMLAHPPSPFDFTVRISLIISRRQTA